MGHNESWSTLKGNVMSQEIVELRVIHNYQFEKTNIVLAIMRTFTHEVPWPGEIFSTPYTIGKNCGWHLTYFDGKKTNTVNVVCNNVSGGIDLHCGDYSQFCPTHCNVTSQDILTLCYDEDYSQAAAGAVEYLLNGHIDQFLPRR